MNESTRGIDIYSRLGFSDVVASYAQTLPRLNDWSVKMHESGGVANVAIKYVTDDQTKELCFDIPTALSVRASDSGIALPGDIEGAEKFLQEQKYKGFLKYKPCIDPCVAFFSGSALFFHQNVVPSLYVTLFVMAVTSIYFGPSIFREAFRFFNSHPFNEINELYKLLMGSKDDEVIKKIEALFQDDGHLALRSRFVGFSPYDKRFQLKYAFVNGYIAYQLKEYDRAEVYFARALSLVTSSSERFYVLKAYVNMLNESGRPLDSKLENVCKEIMRESIVEQNGVMLKDKLQAVLQSLCIHDEEKAGVLLDKIGWSKFDDILYPNVAVTYYSLKQLFCLMMKSTQGDSGLDVETYFKRALHYRDLSEAFRKKCEEPFRENTSLVSKYN